MRLSVLPSRVCHLRRGVALATALCLALAGGLVVQPWGMGASGGSDVWRAGTALLCQVRTGAVVTTTSDIARAFPAESSRPDTPQRQEPSPRQGTHHCPLCFLCNAHAPVALSVAVLTPPHLFPQRQTLEAPAVPVQDRWLTHYARGPPAPLHAIT